jgi:hypothetical protein
MSNSGIVIFLLLYTIVWIWHWWVCRDIMFRTLLKLVVTVLQIWCNCKSESHCFVTK